jgi:thymidylate synthase (FAD)
MIAHTTMIYEAAYIASDRQWVPDEFDEELYNEAGDLSEFAGRMCYQSWNKPNPDTATNAGYLANIKTQQHYSVLEHGSVTFAFIGVSRSLSHELVRHRHFSPSQLSQRFVKPDGQKPVIPPLFRDNKEAVALIEDHWERSCELYETLTDIALGQLYGDDAAVLHKANKRAREAARSVLPNSAPTSIVFTGNHRSWREFLDKRGTEHADAEIRELAIAVFRELAELEPNMYADYELGEAQVGDDVVQVIRKRV